MTPRAGTGRVVTGLLLLAVTGRAVRRGVVGPRETAVFRAVNGLPDGLQVALWPVMQVGSLASPLSLGAVLAVTGRRHLGVQLAASGTTAWVAAKAVKRACRRPRPDVLLRGTVIRGREASGLGYVSGHAAVATALASAAALRSPRLGVLLCGSVPVVGLARVHVGAHLPLDVVGGVAVGLLSDALVASSLPGRLVAAGAFGLRRGAFQP